MVVGLLKQIQRLLAQLLRLLKHYQVHALSLPNLFEGRDEWGFLWQVLLYA
jgi:hypothetical protein